ncbi:Putative N-acetyl-LL-diaminopimelate aminotransferase [Rosistilla carotiformis]|uniref:Aminotransferase n=1 Tax=Rosistilla carotiformis TaxID=2528017 RepID=A0A518K1V9_9BACT|nr:aminotransferase class I/II-fold pyridoxal phosphate-dependent enzyme [Rosistilla carotiformis]QDV71794.1 Putative N-acetyl-LL-diaminopimelate aminotransferase [Rosistilla carotiformis]
MTKSTHPWLADRTAAFDSSGIRRVFDLAATLKDPINLSIGQPDFDVPDPVKQACVAAINSGKNAYSQTQGIAPLRDKLQSQLDAQYGHADRKVFVTSGTSGGLVLSMFAMVNPGDEVIFFDPFFVMYPPLIKLVGGVPVPIDTYPDFKIDIQKVADAITPRTKMILLNSPGNPTGVIATEQEQRELAALAAERGIALVSDEIYSRFCYTDRFISPAEFNDQTIVIDGFSKSHAMTGWRVGFVHGPTAVVETMTKLQQYSFVCAPQPAQWAALEAIDVDVDDYRQQYQGKRDRIIDALKDDYEIEVPGGAFYIFPKVPWGTGTTFVEAAIAAGLLIIPGGIFSGRDTHFRISYAASDQTIDRGIEVLKQLARSGPKA